MPSPSDRRYTDTHEWHRLEGDVLTIGITRHAVDELTDITYVEMKPPGESIAKGEPVGEVESVKATSDVYSALPGEVVEVNDALSEDPSLVNTDPYDKGWLIRIRVAESDALETLMEAGTYDEKYA